ncbi:MAG: hypothetical protein JNL11_12975 [Bdellovibrionaceae bacterium]|nr:hypothetical protein [Pseudobdellovibrionaceae bacterium]
MKILSILLFLGFSVQASVTQVTANSGWTNLPYCNGKTRVTCETLAGGQPDPNKCSLEITGTNCTNMNLYTSSAFYPSVWTVTEKVNRMRDNKYTLLPNHFSGFEKKYFYVFITTEGNRSYTKIKYNLYK